MSAPALVLVESNTTGTGERFAAAAVARGLRPVLLASCPARYPWAGEGGVDTLVIDTSCLALVASTCQRLARSRTLVGVLSSSEYFVATAAAVARHLGLPGADPEAVAACRDKRRQRAVLRRAGVTVPDWREARSAAAAVRAAREVGFPVVLKPVDGTGSRGVRLCRGPAEVVDHTEALLAARTDERGAAIAPVVLVERYVDGPEVSVETFGGEVVSVTAKHLGPLPGFVERGHDVPACGRGAIEAAGLARRALVALGLGFGPAHVEIRLSAGGPVVIEVNPRLAGGQIPLLVQLAYGFDMVAATVDVSVGRRPAPRPPAGRVAAAIRFLLVPDRGVLAGVDGRDAALAVPGVSAVAVTARSGHVVGGTGSFADRVAYVVATAATAGAAAVVAERALGKLRARLEAVGLAPTGS